MKPGRRIPAICLAVALIACLAIACGCTPSTAAPALERPESVTVRSGGVESEYAEGSREYETAFGLLKNVRLDKGNALATAIDPEMGLKECDYIEFAYASPQRTGGDSSEAGSAGREYDRLLFCFTGPVAGEVVLGLGGEYASGTYRIGSAAWPL